MSTRSTRASGSGAGLLKTACAVAIGGGIGWGLTVAFGLAKPGGWAIIVGLVAGAVLVAATRNWFKRSVIGDEEAPPADHG